MLSQLLTDMYRQTSFWGLNIWWLRSRSQRLGLIPEEQKRLHSEMLDYQQAIADGRVAA